MIAFASLLLIAALSSDQSRVVEESIDLIELNHFHDALGREVYQQVIFFEWSEEHQEYHVRAWCLIEEYDPASRKPIKSQSNQRYHVRWHDRTSNIERHLHSEHFRESWTQVDPERTNKKLLAENQRTALAKHAREPRACLVSATEQTADAPDGLPPLPTRCEDMQR